MNEWSCTSTPPILLHGVVLGWGKYRDNFYKNGMFFIVYIKFRYLTVSNLNSIKMFKHYFSETHFNIILLSMTRFPNVFPIRKP